MEACDWMKLFLETGVPEYYLLYKDAVRQQASAEMNHVL